MREKITFTGIQSPFNMNLTYHFVATNNEIAESYKFYEHNRIGMVLNNNINNDLFESKDIFEKFPAKHPNELLIDRIVSPDNIMYSINNKPIKIDKDFSIISQVSKLLKKFKIKDESIDKSANFENETTSIDEAISGFNNELLKYSSIIKNKYGDNINDIFEHAEEISESDKPFTGMLLGMQQNNVECTNFAKTQETAIKIGESLQRTMERFFGLYK